VVVPIEEWKKAERDHREAERLRRLDDLLFNPKWKDHDGFDIMDWIPEFRGTLEAPDFDSPEPELK
jgi:hypothetical protein